MCTNNSNIFVLTNKLSLRNPMCKQMTDVVWHDVGHSFLWVWVWVSTSQIPCLFWGEANTKGLRAKSPWRPKEDEGRQGPRAVNRSRGKATVREGWLLNEELGPVDIEAGWANVRGWVSVPGGCVGISAGYSLVITHRCIESYRKVPKLLPSCAWS